MSGYLSKLAGPPEAGARPARDRYRIVGRIASGGMAEIYLARTIGGGEREVVLKRLMPELQSDHEFVQMFYDEARIAHDMRHPNIVHIYELGELDGSLFIAMELLRGPNLRDLLARLHARGEELPIPLAVRIACGALDALSYAHRFTDQNGRLLNVVHRDVSPQNIIVTYDGAVKLVDFGVAKAEGRLHRTRAGLIKGKFAYMSPEQVSGGKVDGRSDLFALGEVFYELLVRRHPFYAATDMEVLRAILDVDPPHPTTIDPQFPPELASILMRAMRKLPGDRWPNAAAMLDAMEQFLQNQRALATTAALGRFTRELFSDRVELEERARETGDDDLLITAMTSGRSERAPQDGAGGKRRTRLPSIGSGSHAVPPLEPRRRPRPEPAEDLEETHRLLPSGHSGARDQVVEVARRGEAADARSAPGTLDGEAPLFMAHSGYTSSSGRRRRVGSELQSQVQRLFDDPAEALPFGAPDGPAGIEDTHEDPRETAEIPTQLGELTEEELREIRGSVQRGRDAQVPRGPRDTASTLEDPISEARAEGGRSPRRDRPDGPRADHQEGVRVEPVKLPSGPAVRRSPGGAGAPVEPRGDPALRATPPTLRGVDADSARDREPRGDPALRATPPALRGAAPAPSVPVTPRSRTVLQPEELPARPRQDPWGLILFVSGLGALIGAIVYAVVLYAAAQSATMRIVVRSEPKGAQIWLDGADTGLRTPGEMEAVPSNAPHTLELRLDGYLPYQRTFPSSPELGELIIEWRFREEPSGAPR